MSVSLLPTNIAVVDMALELGPPGPNNREIVFYTEKHQSPVAESAVRNAYVWDLGRAADR